MKRRTYLSLAVAGACALGLPPARAQVVNLNDAINKAGRQRMLSQRLGKAWLALLQGVETANAQAVLDRSLALFDRQLVELKGFAPTPEIQATYSKLEIVWSEYKTALTGISPKRANAATLLQLDSRVLSLAHQGTVQYEAVLDKPVGKLVNVAGRQRMLTQRMAKFYLAAMLPVDSGDAATEIAKARSEFLAAMTLLRSAPEATARIKDELVLADAQWLFFDAALQKLKQGAQPRPMADVFVASENLLSVMDRVTGLYSALTT
jgi:Type IV pili methyl-accepting chemotaxis transducer N-term